LLRQAVFKLKHSADPNLLVGFDKADDAAVYRLTPDLALVQTVDFFTPIVDDPVWYGRISAANSLSDVYAMGGKPLTALNIFCFPGDFEESHAVDIISKILGGGLEKMTEAGCTLVGGHSVQDPEMKYGLSVTGTIDPKRIFSNDKLQPGQILVLTKKLGTGIITTAAKSQDCPETLLDGAVRQMATLNDKACSAMLKTGATGCTDITGFGFMGHLSEMTRGSGVSVRIEASQVPRFAGVEALVEKKYLTRGDKTNREYTAPSKMEGVDEVTKKILFDPQTSGGLLISMPSGDFESFRKEMRQSGQDAWKVGEAIAKDPAGSIEVVPS
jgi:selenide, water dikinase